MGLELSKLVAPLAGPLTDEQELQTLRVALEERLRSLCWCSSVIAGKKMGTNDEKLKKRQEAKLSTVKPKWHDERREVRGTPLGACKGT